MFFFSQCGLYTICVGILHANSYGITLFLRVVRLYLGQSRGGLKVCTMVIAVLINR